MLVKLTDTLRNFIFYKRYLTSILSHGMGWDGMGWDGTGRDGTKILQNRPIPWDEKFLEVSHPMMGRKF